MVEIEAVHRQQFPGWWHGLVHHYEWAGVISLVLEPTPQTRDSHPISGAVCRK